jgi:hypothetical protein
MSPTAPKSKMPPTERRAGQDRRTVEGSPPSRRERRRGLEARKPEVSELEMTSAEWAALNAAMQLPAPAAPKK